MPCINIRLRNSTNSLPLVAGALAECFRFCASLLQFFRQGRLFRDGRGSANLERLALLARLLLQLKQLTAAIFEMGGELLLLFVQGEAPLFQTDFILVQRRLLGRDRGGLNRSALRSVSAALPGGGFVNCKRKRKKPTLTTSPSWTWAKAAG